MNIIDWDKFGAFCERVGVPGVLIVAFAYLAVRYVPKIVASVVSLNRTLEQNNSDNAKCNTKLTETVCRLADSDQESTRAIAQLAESTKQSHEHHISTMEALKSIAQGVGRVESKIDTLHPVLIQHINHSVDPPTIGEANS